MRDPSQPDQQPSAKLLSSKRIESLKLSGAAFDRMSTVVIGGAVFAPIFQGNAIEFERTAF